MSRGPFARRALALAGWVLLALLAGLVIARTPFTADLSAFLPAAPDARQRLLTEQLQGGVPARTLLAGIDGGDADSRAAASRALAQALRAGGLFEQVNNGERSAWAAVGQWVVEHRYALSPAIEPARFEPAGLRDALDETVALLGTPAGTLAKRLLDRDPTGETQRIAEASLGGDRGPALHDGVWVSADGRRALLMLVTRADGADLDAQARAIDAVRQAFDAVPQRTSAAAGTPPLALRLSGAPRFAVDSRARIESEVKQLSTTGAVVIGGVLLLAFGSVIALGAMVLPVAAGVLAGIAAVGLVFGSVHGITLGFGVTLLGEAVDYAIYYLVQAHAWAPAGWRTWLRRGWPTVRLGLLTSICGFAALVFSGLPGLAQLGVFSIAGLLAAAATTRFVLPVLLPDGTRGSPLRRALGRAAGRALRALPRWRPVVSAVGVGAALWIATQHASLWETDLSTLSPVPAEALALDASLRAELTSTDAAALVVVQAADAETALQRAEAAGARLDPLVADGRLSGYDSATRLLPSLQTQQRRRAALPAPARLQAALGEATAGGPLPAARLAPFVADVDAARAAPALTPASIAGTPAAPIVDALLWARPGGGWVALLPLHARGDTIDVDAVDAALAGLADVQVVQIGAELKRLYRHFLDEALTQALTGAAGVVLLMALALRSPRRLLAVCVPLALAVLLTVAGLRAFQVPLGILHLVGLLLVVAVGSNYALFFGLLTDTDEPPDPEALASLALANLTTVLSFGLIALSSIPVLAAIGRVVAPGALLALLLSAAYAPRRRAPRPAPAAADRV